MGEREGMKPGGGRGRDTDTDSAPEADPTRIERNAVASRSKALDRCWINGGMGKIRDSCFWKDWQAECRKRESEIPTKSFRDPVDGI